MHYRESIGYPTSFDRVSEWIRDKAANDGRMVLHAGRSGSYWVILAGSESLADWAAEQLQRGSTASPTMGLLTVSPQLRTVAFSQDCGGVEHKMLVEMVVELLDSFSEYRVFDEETSEEITDLVKADPEAELFDQ